MSASSLTPAPEVAAIDALLPQTQCMRCGYAGCRPYAEALASGTAALNRCPPGGAHLIAVLATHLGRPPLPLDPQCGVEAPARVAVVVAAECTGCARCLPACPVDAIVGTRRALHTVLAGWCTGCELCLAACPVDCIRMVGTAAGDPPPPEAADNRARFQAHQQRRRDGAAERARLLAERKRAAPAAHGTGST